MVASHHASLLATRPAFDVEVSRRTSLDNSSTYGGYFGGSSGMASVGLVPRSGLAALFSGTPATASSPTPFAGSSVPEHQVGFTGYPFGNDYHSLGSEGRSSGEFMRLSGRGSQAVSIPCTPSRAKERGPSSFSVSASTASRTVHQSCSPKTLSRLHIQVGGKDESSYEPRLPAALKRTSPGVAAIAASASDSLTPQSRSVGFRVTWGDRASGPSACGTTSTTAAGASAAAPSRPSSFTRDRGLSGLFTDLTSSSPSGSYTASPVLSSKPSRGSAAAVLEYRTAEIMPLGASPGAIPAQSSRRPMQRMPLKEDPELAMARERVLSMIEAANGLAPPVLHQQLVFRDPVLDGAQQQQQHQKQAPAHMSDGELLQQAQQQHAVFHDQLVKKAFHVAASAHQGQLRKNGEPFLVHCLETALILAKTGLDRKVVAAGLLHDTLDDSMMSEEQLQELFGEEIAALVVGVSNLSTLSQTLRDSGRLLAGAEADRMRTMILSMGDWRVVLVKLADRLHNLRTIAALPVEKQRRVAAETLEVFAPLANRLGIWSWKAEIEDVCFRTLQPVEYAELSEAVRERSAEEAVMAAIRKLDGALKVEGVSYQDLHGRSKNLLSIHKKMEKKGKTLDEIFDMRGLRLIVADEASCYRALSVVRSLWGEDHRQFKDYVAEPKPNGYQSIHVVLRGDDGHPLEVQIRTAAMHHAAEYGVAAHWRYKESGPGDERSGRTSAPLTAISSGSTSTCSSVSSSSSSALGGVGLAGVCGESPSSLLEEGDSDSPEDEEDDEAEQRHAAKRVEWLRFVLSWYCEMSDAKLRLEQPVGPGLASGASYGHAYSATSVGCSHRGGVSNGAQSQRHSPHRQQELASFHSHGRSERAQPGGCQFPEHAADCCFRMESGMPPPELPASEAIFVVLQENNEISVKKLPGSQTTADFLENYLEQHSQRGQETRASLMVNSRLVSPSEHKRLAMGDLVQVLFEDEVIGEGPVEGAPFVDEEVDHTVGALSPMLAPMDKTFAVEEREMMAAYPGLLLPAHASSLRHCSSHSLDSLAIPGSLEEADRLTLEFHRQRLSAAWGEGVGSGAAAVGEPELGLRLRL